MTRGGGGGLSVSSIHNPNPFPRTSISPIEKKMLPKRKQAIAKKES